LAVALVSEVVRLAERVKNFLVTRGQAYRKTFRTIYGERVLTDLAAFCRANESTFVPDPRAEGILQGRREVWLRISKHLNLSEDELQVYFNPQGE
jgi:hypothetical protein